MAVVQVRNKEVIEKIQSILIVKLGRKISQQDVLEMCVLLGSQNIDKLVQMTQSRPIITPEIAARIIQDFDEFKGTFYDANAKCPSDIDTDAYL